MKTMYILLTCVFLLPFFSCTETPLEPAPAVVDRTVTNATVSLFSYAGNGHTRGDVPAPPTYYKTGAEVTLLSNPGNMITTAGEWLYAWNTRQDGSGQDYLPDSTFTMPASNVTMYAKWRSWAMGGDYSYTIGIYKYHVFTNAGTNTLTITGSGVLDVLIVAGGGGGGCTMGGGGGGGGVIYQAAYTGIAAGTSVTVIVGAGGAGAPAGGTEGQPTANPMTKPAKNGGNSSFGSFIAIGGGAGGTGTDLTLQLGSAGGSGGGASGYGTPTGTGGGAGTAGQGNRGGNGGGSYYSGGGGGAGAQGTDATATPHGGAGILNAILGYDLYWAGGGGGAAYSVSPGGNGGIGGGGGGAVGVTTGGAGYNNGQPGGGGAAVTQCNTPGGDAGANTGGGGGGGSHYNANNKGGDGGSGIVIIRYVY